MQEGKTTLTKREKVLIMLVIAVAILAGSINFAIIPLSNWVSDQRTELGDLQTERTRIEGLLAMEQSNRNSYDEALRQYNELREEIPSQSQSSEVGRMLTNLCLDHRLSPTNQRLSEPAVYKLARPVTDPETGEPTGETTEEETPFYVITARMMANSDYASLKSLLDEVDNTPYIRAIRVSFTESSDRNETRTVTIDPNDPDATPLPIPAPNPYELRINTVSIDFEVTILGN